MKQYYYALLLLFVINASAQVNYDGPWMAKMKPDSIQLANSKGDQSLLKKPTFKEVQLSFEEYWKTHDKDEKGSGYKPFKRFEQVWGNNLDENGNFPEKLDPLELWNLQKKETQYIEPSLGEEANRASVSSNNWFSMGEAMKYTSSWAPGQARTSCIAVDPKDAKIWYVGTPGGGLWKSSNSGANWIPLTDKLPQLGIGSVAIDPQNSKTIYIATGDRDSQNVYGVGVWRSLNSGATWTLISTLGGTTYGHMTEICFHPTNSKILWLATSHGLYKTVNSGAVFTRIYNGDIRDFKLKPKTPDTLYFIANDSFVRSTNGGTSFTVITSGLPSSNKVGRMVIGVTPANINYVYLLVANYGARYTYNGIYRSVNSGVNFELRNNTTDVFESTQAWYDLAIAVSTTNAETIWTGVLNIWRSTNGGASLSRLNNWNISGSTTAEKKAYTHADIHKLQVFGTTLFACTDGGIYSSIDNGTNFLDKTKGIIAGQHNNLSVSKSSVNVISSAMQDNGNKFLSDRVWKNFTGADGSDALMHPTNTAKSYCTTQEGGMGALITTNSGGSYSQIQKPNNSSYVGQFVMPMAINNAGRVYMGYPVLTRLNSRENGWEYLAQLGGAPTKIRIADSNNKIMYFAVDTRLLKSLDGGATVTIMKYFNNSITDIAVHPGNPDAVLVTLPNDILSSTDGGTNFTSVKSGLPLSANYFTINCVAFQAGQPGNPYYIGCSSGIYRRSSTETWAMYSANLPNVRITDLDVTGNIITASTYGRGVWRSALPSATTKSSSDANTMQLTANGYLENDINIYPNPTTGNFYIDIDTSLKGDMDITIYNLSGQNLYNKSIPVSKNFENQNIDINHFQSGIYMLKVVIDGKEYSKRIIKQ